MLSTNARFDDDEDEGALLLSCKIRALLLDRDKSEDEEEDELAEESAEEMCRSAVSDSVCLELSTS